MQTIGKNSATRVVFSRWSMLPKTVIDLIYSFDVSYHDHMTTFVFDKKPHSKTRFEKESPFYKSVVKKRYATHNADILLILNEKSAYKTYPVFPVWTDLQVICNYTMMSSARLCSKNRIIYKQIFKFNKKIHWYICVDTEITLCDFLKKFLSLEHIDFLGFSEILLFDNLTETTNHLVYETTGKKFRKNLNWFKGKEYENVVMKDFDIIVKNRILEIDVLNIFSFNNKIYLNLHFDHNRSIHYDYNKAIYDMFIYYINMRLRPDF